MELTAPGHSPRECLKVNELLGRIGDRWTLRVVVTLHAQPLRFNQLRRAVDGISQQMLTRTLKTLERDGMLTRTVHPSVPPQVEYGLTPLGHSLADRGMQLGGWISDHLAEIDDHRARYDMADATQGH
ncbi:helix-turn-helix transcriptional regulator [Sphingomonas sp. LaA6.9]|nr:helix-turn-helix domain-containing protein [Sphingomonas sp. LaA6.9]MCJ8159104.1 helix-turn-helix transcriptional regulator [Sphingomonas sp. LaA6.9]